MVERRYPPAMRHSFAGLAHTVRAIGVAIATMLAFPGMTHAAADCNVNRNLVNADLTGCDLSGVDLTGAMMSGATLYNADLTGAILVGADLTKATLRGAGLSYADTFYRLTAVVRRTRSGDLRSVARWGASPPLPGGACDAHPFVRLQRLMPARSDADTGVNCARGMAPTHRGGG
ncbi:MAG: hypothetical protein RL345_2524 [Chloroflexota bacterium]